MHTYVYTHTHTIVFTNHSGIFRGENIYLPWRMLTKINVFGILSKASGSFFFRNVKIFSTVFFFFSRLLLLFLFVYSQTLCIRNTIHCKLLLFFFFLFLRLLFSLLYESPKGLSFQYHLSKYFTGSVLRHLFFSFINNYFYSCTSFFYLISF